jgi:hypothetical protein
MRALADRHGGTELALAGLGAGLLVGSGSGQALASSDMALGLTMTGA